ncbi:hypothetical protein B296_00056950, partial [Ensete ventricosum]
MRLVGSGIRTLERCERRSSIGDDQRFQEKIEEKEKEIEQRPVLGFSSLFSRGRGKESDGERGGRGFLFLRRYPFGAP